MVEHLQESVDIALTGHRPNKLFGYNLNHPSYQRMMTYLEGIIESALAQCQRVTIRTGMALGADTVWALAALKVKERLGAESHRLTLVAHIPFETQPNAWISQVDKDRWAWIRSQCDEEFITYRGRIATHKEAGQWLNQRNRDMIGPATHVVAIWDGSRGGTGNAVADARAVKKKLIVVDPASFA